jgi:hypothetical protein
VSWKEFKEFIARRRRDLRTIDWECDFPLPLRPPPGGPENRAEAILQKLCGACWFQSKVVRDFVLCQRHRSGLA